MRVELSPSLHVQRAIHAAASDFLGDLAAAGFVEGIEARPRVNPEKSPFYDVTTTMAMGRLERALNPGRLRAGDPALGNVGCSSPFGERHLLILTRSLKELKDGFSATLAHWGMDRYWGHSTCSFSSRGVEASGMPPGHESFEEPENGYLPLPRRLFDALTLAAKELADCIQVAEKAEQTSIPTSETIAPANPAPTPTDPRKDPTLRELLSSLVDYERASQATGPFVRSMSGRPVDGWSEMQGQMAHAVGLGVLRHQIDTMLGYEELRTFTLRKWGEGLTAAVCRRLIGELLRQLPKLTCSQVESLTLREASEVLNDSPSSTVEELLDFALVVRNDLDDPTSKRDEILNGLQVRKVFVYASELGLARRAEAPDGFLTADGARRLLDSIIPTLRSAIASSPLVVPGETKREPPTGKGSPADQYSAVYRLIDTCDALALTPHRWEELTSLYPTTGYDAGSREHLEIWHAVFGEIGVAAGTSGATGPDTLLTVPAGLVHRAGAEIHGDAATTIVIREMGNWLTRWGRAFHPFAPVGEREAIMREQRALPIEWWMTRCRVVENLTRLGVSMPEDLTARPGLNVAWNGQELVTHQELMAWLSITRPPVTRVVAVAGICVSPSIVSGAGAVSLPAEDYERLRVRADERDVETNAPPAVDPCTHGLLLLADAQRKGEKPKVAQLAEAMGVSRQALYENKDFAQVRDMANKLFRLFGKEVKKGDWSGPRGSKSKDGTLEAEDPTDAEL